MKPDHERIWLQPGAGDCGETTWCQDRVLDDDIEYVRKDIHDAALLDAHQRGRLEGMGENQRLRQIISECATAAGAFVSPDATVEFMAFLPKEIAAIRSKMEEQP